VEENILQGGEKELLELKKTLQEKDRYNGVLGSLDAATKEQREKIEQRKKEIEDEMNLEIERRREAVAKPFHDEIAVCEEEIKRVNVKRSVRRQELVEQMVKEEEKFYKKRKDNLEKQIKLIGQEEGVPAVCTSRLFLAFFCPRNGKDALILVAGLLVLLLALPMALYFGVYGGNNRQALLTIYLILIIFFYTLYLLINNLVKDKYLVGINKLIKLYEERETLEIHRKKREKELEEIPDSALDLKEFDDEIKRLQSVVGELTKQKDVALVNFDSDQRLQLDIAKEIQDKFKPELDQMRAVLEENISSYNKMKKEFDKFMKEKKIEIRYEPLQRVEPNIFSQAVIDELLFYISHNDAETINRAIIMRNKHQGQSFTM